MTREQCISFILLIGGVALAVVLCLKRIEMAVYATQPAQGCNTYERNKPIPL